MSTALSRLAIEDGDPVRTSAFPAWPVFSDDEVAAVTRVLRSGGVNYWTGDEGERFEERFADFVGTEHAVALANGTIALEAALHGVGIGPGDDVVVASRTFIASGSCIVRAGARPVMADVDRVSQNVTADTIADALTPDTRGIIVVHLAGWPCEMEPILELARDHDLRVIEDCAQAHGATYRGRPVGSFGDVGAFSFCQDKIMTLGGEGGMITTGDDEVWSRVWSLKDHGKSYDAVFNREHPPGFRWLHESFGTNGRMTNMQAAIGRIQLDRLPDWLRRRRRNAGVLTDRFAELPALRVTPPPEGIGHAYYKYYAFVRPEMLESGWDRDRIMVAVEAEGVPCYQGICSEIYREKAFADAGLEPRERLDVARRLGETSLMFPVHPTLDEHDMADIGRAVRKVLEVATR